MITTSIVHNQPAMLPTSQRSDNAFLACVRSVREVTRQTYGGHSPRIDALSSHFATSFADCVPSANAMRIDARQACEPIPRPSRADTPYAWHCHVEAPDCCLRLKPEGEFTMRTYRHLATIVIFVTAGLQACSNSNTPGAMGSGGSTSTSGTGGAGGGTIVQCHATGTFTVTNQGMSAYLIDGTANPTLTLCRGSTYVFAISATGHPFHINTV